MLNSITWTEFLTYLGAAVGLYYLWLIVKVGRRKGSSPRQAPFKRKWRMEETPDSSQEKNAGTDIPHAASEEIGTEDATYPDDDRQYEALEGLARDVTGILQDFGDQGELDILLDRLRQEIRRYPTLQPNGAFHVAINRVIIEGARQYCMLTITEKQAESLWDADQDEF